MFDDKNLKTLEYFKILDMLAKYTQSAGGKVKALELRPFQDAELCVELSFLYI